MRELPLSITRRHLLAGAAFVVMSASSKGAAARLISNGIPWRPNEAWPPLRFRPGPWLFFTATEAAAVEAIVDRLIPGDSLSLGGRDAGCAVFIDRQLAGPYGQAQAFYMLPPFANGTAQQGIQSPDGPGNTWRAGLAALDAYCRSQANAPFAQLKPEQQDTILGALEKGQALPNGTNAKAFFELALQNTMEGFFADPLYGGNHDMTAWKMLQFPGAYYDWRDDVDKHNQKITLPPLSIVGMADPAGL